MVSVFQEPDVWRSRHARTDKPLLQIVGVDEQACPLEVVPLEEEQDLMRVVGITEEPPSLRAVSPARRFVLGENRLPGRVILDLVADQQTGHERLRSP